MPGDPGVMRVEIHGDGRLVVIAGFVELAELAVAFAPVEIGRGLVNGVGTQSQRLASPGSQRAGLRLRAPSLSKRPVQAFGQTPFSRCENVNFPEFGSATITKSIGSAAALSRPRLT